MLADEVAPVVLEVPRELVWPQSEGSLPFLLVGLRCFADDAVAADSGTTLGLTFPTSPPVHSLHPVEAGSVADWERFGVGSQTKQFHSAIHSVEGQTGQVEDHLALDHPIAPPMDC